MYIHIETISVPDFKIRNGDTTVNANVRLDFFADPTKTEVWEIAFSMDMAISA
jgi:hypothetical protein